MKIVSIYKQFVNIFSYKHLSHTVTCYNKINQAIKSTIGKILIYMNLDNHRQNLPQLLIFILSLADDALLLGLSRIGLHFAWLRWLSPVLTGGMVLHFAWQFYNYRLKSCSK
jgi:hypothetical protein